MKFRWLGPLGAMLAFTALVRSGPLVINSRESGPCPASCKEQAGYVVLPGDQGPSHSRVVPYYPKAGDILLYDDMNKFHHFAFKIAGTGPPTHAAIVIEREDHKPVLLELTGPTVINSKVIIMEAGPRLQSYPGTIMVRRPRQPLTPEQCTELSQFALSQEGKYIAFRRGLLQATPFCARTGLRRRLFGHTFFSRKRWFCSEIVVAAACAAHLLDPKDYPANAMYPRDLAYDERFDLSGVFQKPVPWVADPHSAIDQGLP